MNLTLTDLIAGVSLMAVVQWLVQLLISERLKASLTNETNAKLKELEWQVKKREQAARVAEYLAFAWQLRADAGEEAYERANRLSWELALWLPSDLYYHVVRAVSCPSDRENVLTALAAARLALDEKSGPLDPSKMAYHAPNAGQSNGMKPGSP